MRKSRWAQLLSLLVVGLAIQSVKSDLPIHCVKAQVEGDWEFHLASPSTPKSFQDASCGFSLPSSAKDAQTHKPDDRFKSSSVLRLKLDPFNQVFSEGRRVGTWTMVYDEAISVEIEQGSFFVYFEFDNKHGVSVTTCSRTLIGWYRDPGLLFGCFHARQIAALNRITPVSIGSQILNLSAGGASASKVTSLARASGSIVSGQAEFQRIMKAKLQQSSLKAHSPFISLAETESESEADSQEASQNDSEDTSEQKVPPPVHPSPAKPPVTAPIPVKPVPKAQPPKPKPKGPTKPPKVVHLNPIVAKPLSTPPKRSKPTKSIKKRQPASKKVQKLLKVAQKSAKLVSKSVSKKKPIVKGTVVKKGVQKRNPPKGLVHRKGTLLNIGKKGALAKPGRKRVLKKVAPPKPKLRKGEVLPWKDPKLKVNEPEYHVRRFWMDMNMHWVTKKGTDKSLAQVGSEVLQERSRSDVLVDAINQGSLGWKATNYAFLAGKSITEVNQMAGRPKISNKLNLGTPQMGNDVESLRRMTNLAQKDLKLLPKELDLSKYLSKPRTQNNCGNCYLIASIAMLESRLRYKQNRDFPLSIQYVNDCNFYSQGCNGGFAVETMRFIRDFWVPPEQCKPFISSQGSCTPGCMFGKLKEVVTVEKPYYIGEFFGHTTESLLMQDLIENGPLVVSIEPPETFAYYKSGIYQPNSPLVAQSFGGKTQWTKVDHSVLLYGWGEENNTRFWRVQNSWGPDWGEQGTCRIIRGTNAIGIEAMGEAGIPKIVTLPA